MNIIEALTEVLGKFDQEIKPFSERDVSKAISSIRDPKDASELPVQFIAEIMAFDFWEQREDQITESGTYYGPMWVLNNEDGTASEYPSVKKVTEQIIKYWTDRAKTAKHPVLRARYADLVWDFQKIVTNEAPHYSVAQIVIDSTIEIAQRNCYQPQVNVIRKLKRALSLAIVLNNSSQIEKVTTAIISYEDTVTDDSKLGLWGFSYDFLFENDKIDLTNVQKQKLIADLEGHLLRASQPAKPEKLDPWAVNSAALRLARYYRKIGKTEDTRRVLVSIGNAFIQASSKASALQTSAWLQGVHTTYREFGLKAEAEEISIKLRELGKKVRSELKPISHTMEISREKMYLYVAALTKGEFDEVLARIAVHFIPKKSEVQKQIKELANVSPMVFLFRRKLLDNQGRPLAQVDSLEDMPGHIAMQMSQNMTIESIFLRQVIESLVKKHPKFKSLCVDYIFRSPIFQEDRRSIIESGITEYLNGNYVVSVHLLIPQIEQAIRILLEKAGGSVLKAARSGGFNLKTMDELLRDPLLLQIFGEDIEFYFRVLLVDPRGWNLRNCVCHGLCNASAFDTSMSDRIIHILLCLALVRQSNNAHE
jgi:hypothetical protein